MNRILAGAAIAALTIFALTIWHFVDRRAAVEEGRTLERTAAVERTVETIKNRSATNATVKTLDRSGICRELGGQWVQVDGAGECQ